MDLVSVKRLLDAHRPQEALQELSLQSIHVKPGSAEQVLYESMILRAFLLQGDYRRVVDRGLEVIREVDTGRFPVEHALLRLYIIEGKWKLGERNGLLGELRESLNELLDSCSHGVSCKNLDWVRGLYLFRWGSMLIENRELDEALELLGEAKSLLEGADDSTSLCLVWTNIGIVHWFKGLLDEAVASYERALEYAVKVGNKHDEARVLYNLGVLLLGRGEFTVALRYFQQAYDVYRVVGPVRQLVLSLNSMGSIAFERAELESALSYYNHALELVRSEGVSDLETIVLNNIALTLQAMGDFDGALETFEEVKRLLEGGVTDRVDSLAVLYYNLVLLHLKRGSVDRILGLLRELNTLRDEHAENAVVRVNYKIAQALYFKSRNRLSSKARALELLQDVLENERLDVAKRRVVVLNLCDLLYFEVVTLGAEEAMEDLWSQVRLLHEFAEKEHVKPLLVYALILEAKLLLLENQLDRSLELLEKARVLSESMGILNMSVLSTKVFDEILRERELWERLEHEGKSLREKARYLRLESLIMDSLTQTVSFEEAALSESPFLFLLLDRGYERRFTRGFESEEWSREGSMRFLEMFDVAVKEWSLEEGKLYRFFLGERMLLAQREEGLVFVYVYSGNSYPAIQKFSGFWKAIKLYGTILDEVSRGERDYLLDEEVLFLDSLLREFIDDKANLVKDLDVAVGSVDELVGERLSPEEQKKRAKELISYRKIFHPIKLAILKLLYQSYRLTAAELRSFIGVPWGTFETHYKALQKRGSIEVRVEFEEIQPKTVLYITNQGAKEYVKLRESLKAIL